MAFTNNWTENLPDGDAEQASTCDDYLRQWRVDLGERFEDMFYGFNAGSGSSPEDVYGVKHLKFRNQSASPSSASSYGFVFTKAVSGVTELFFLDSSGNEKQLTTGGQLNVVAADIPNDTLDSQHYAAGSIDAEHLASDSVTAAKIENLDPDSYAAEESVTLPNGLVRKFGYVARSGTGATVTFGTAFSTAVVSANVTCFHANTSSNYPAHIGVFNTTTLTVVDTYSTWTGYYWEAIGY